MPNTMEPKNRSIAIRGGEQVESGKRVRLPKLFYERPLTPKEAQFAEDNLYIVWWYLDQQRLDRAEWFDVVIFRYLISVKRWFAVPDVRKSRFVTVACNAMKSAIGNERKKAKQGTQNRKPVRTYTRNRGLAVYRHDSGFGDFLRR